jgi:asparagine synthetase B (glutamine-hydrolysing)
MRFAGTFPDPGVPTTVHVDGHVAERLEGHFAMAIATPSLLVLARDGFGTKPLHYYVSDDRSRVVFASTAWDIVSRLDSAPEIDEARLSDFLIFGRMLGDGTLLRGIKTVRPGCMVTMTVAGGRVAIEEHELFDPDPPPPIASLDDALDGITDLLAESVAGCVSGSSRIGVALSGGLDSSVVALVAHAAHDVDLLTFTLRSCSSGSDADAARDLAGRVGASHCEIPLTFDAYLRAIPALIHAREFITPAGITMFLLCERAARDCGACLTGLGAGDCFGDVNEDLNWDLYRSRLRQKVRRAMAIGMPVSDEGHDALEAALSAERYADYFESAGFSDQGVDWIDRCGAAHGVDVHMPFCSETLYSFVRAVPFGIRRGPPPGGDKYLLRCAALKRFGDDASLPVRRAKEAMPDSIVAFHRRFVEMCEAAISDDDVRRHRFGTWVRDKHALVMLDVFTKLFQQRCSPADVSLQPS